MSIAYAVVIALVLLILYESLRWNAARSEERRWQLTREQFAAVPSGPPVASTPRSVD